MFPRSAVAVMLLALTASIGTRVQNKWTNSKLFRSEPALVSPQEVSSREKAEVLKAIKSIYGVKEPVTANDLHFINVSAGDRAAYQAEPERGVVLRTTRQKLYLLTDPCDRDWSEMDILVYSRPYEIKKDVENRYCEIRKIRLRIAEVKPN